MVTETLDVAYVFKWVATGPIIEVRGAEVGSDGWLQYGSMFVSPRYWARTLADAQAKGANVLGHRIRSLRKQVEKLEARQSEPLPVKLKS